MKITHSGNECECSKPVFNRATLLKRAICFYCGGFANASESGETFYNDRLKASNRPSNNGDPVKSLYNGFC